MIDVFNVTTGAVHVGALVFGTDIYSQVNLEGRDNPQSLKLDILTLSRVDFGATSTDKAIAAMRQEFATNGNS